MKWGKAKQKERVRRTGKAKKNKEKERRTGKRR